MDMPKPGEAHKKLATLVGDWQGDETLHPAPWDAGGAATARVSNRWIVDGFAVHQDYEQRRDGQVTFRGHGVIWYDPTRDEYVMHWWDSMGGSANEYRGRFEGDRLALMAPMPQGGHSRTSWLLTGPDAHDFLMEISPDGESWQPAMEGRYKRHAARAGRRAAKKARAGARPMKAASAKAPAKGQGAAKRRRGAARKASGAPAKAARKSAAKASTRKATSRSAKRTRR
jgi:hypothetical protein